MRVHALDGCKENVRAIHPQQCWHQSCSDVAPRGCQVVPQAVHSIVSNACCGRELWCQKSTVLLSVELKGLRDIHAKFQIDLACLRRA